MTNKPKHRCEIHPDLFPDECGCENTPKTIEERVEAILVEYPSHPPMSGSEEGVNLVTVEKIKELLTAHEEEVRREEREKVAKINHLIHEPQKCQNRNGLFYCGTCEQPYEECSCPARNSGARKMKEVILQTINKNK